MRLRQAAPVLVAASLGWSAESAMAQDGWQVTCSEQSRCSAMLALIDQASQTKFATVGVQIGTDGSAPLLVAIVPLGVAVKPGVRVIVGPAAWTAEVEACFPDGCRAVLALPNDDLDALLAAASIEVQYFASGNDTPVAAVTPVPTLREALAGQVALAP